VLVSLSLLRSSKSPVPYIKRRNNRNRRSAPWNSSLVFSRYLDGTMAVLQAIVCTSTLSTAGKSRTIGFQLSPASFEQYTWPPVVPK
jgi:hypothetical protein